MKFSIFRAGAAAVVASLAFAACAGQSGMVPSSTVGGGTTGIGNAAFTSPLAKNPCDLPGWTFGGSCAVAVLKSTGGSASLKAYKGISVSATLGSGAANGTVIVFKDATGKGDITGKVDGHSFPPFTSGGKAFLYIQAANGGKAFTFNSTPKIVITNAAAFPGKTCVLGELSTTLQWKAEPLPSQLKGHTLTFPSLPVHQPVPKGEFFLGFACK